MKLNNLWSQKPHNPAVDKVERVARSRGISIMHVTNGLGNGGAEGVLARICINDTANSHFVVSLTGPGKYAKILLDGGVEVEVLNIRGIWSLVHASIRLLTLIIRRRPEIIQSWMPHSDLLTSLLRTCSPSSKLVWCIRHGNYSKDSSKRRTRAVVRFLGLISSFAPSRIVSCSQAGVEAHVELGYSLSKFEVIPNGTDLSYFRPRRTEPRGAQPSSKPEKVQFGMLGRYHPQKDHMTFFRAIRDAGKARSDFKVSVAGIEPSAARAHLEDICRSYGILELVSIQGEVASPAQFLAGQDFLVSSSSSGEGFPNVLTEAMASEVIPISTDVGDAKLIIGETGYVVPARNPDALSRALLLAIGLSQRDKAKMARATRKRVERFFSQDQMIASYQELYKSLQR